LRDRREAKAVAREAEATAAFDVFLPPLSPIVDEEFWRTGKYPSSTDGFAMVHVPFWSEDALAQLKLKLRDSHGGLAFTLWSYSLLTLHKLIMPYPSISTPVGWHTRHSQHCKK
jgi:hypothetical protein